HLKPPSVRPLGRLANERVLENAPVGHATLARVAHRRRDGLRQGSEQRVALATPDAFGDWQLLGRIDLDDQHVRIDDRPEVEDLLEERREHEDLEIRDEKLLNVHDIRAFTHGGGASAEVDPILAAVSKMPAGCSTPRIDDLIYLELRKRLAERQVEAAAMLEGGDDRAYVWAVHQRQW